MNLPSMSPSTVRAIDLHEKLIKEGTRRITDYQITKFDKIQFKRGLLEDPSSQKEYSEELKQKIFGPEFLADTIKIQYSIIQELSKVNIQQFSLYISKTQPAFFELYEKLNQKVCELIDSCINE